MVKMRTQYEAMRFLIWETLMPSTEIKTLQDRKRGRFGVGGEDRISLERLTFRCPRDCYLKIP